LAKSHLLSGRNICSKGG